MMTRAREKKTSYEIWWSECKPQASAQIVMVWILTNHKNHPEDSILTAFAAEGLCAICGQEGNAGFKGENKQAQSVCERMATTNK